MGGTNRAGKFFWKCRPLLGSAPPYGWARALSVVCIRPLYMPTHHYRVVEMMTVRKVGIVLLKMSLFAGLLTVLHKSIGNKKEIHDLNYVCARGFLEANFRS